MTPSSTPRATRLLAHTASGALTVIRSASARAASTAVPSGTTWLIRPHFSASAELIGSPVKSSSIATLRGRWSTMRNTPPAAAISPRLTSGSPNFARSSATTRSLGEREFGAAAQRGAVDRGDGRLVDVVVDVSREAPFAVVGVEQVLPARYRLEIGSGAEGFTGTGDHHRTHLWIVLRLLQRIAHRDADGAVDGVAGLRPVQRDDEDIAPPLGESGGGGHVSGHSSSMMVALAWPPPSHIVCSPY